MKKLKMSWNEIWPLGNILNEVCHGIKLDIESKIGSSYEEVYELLNKMEACRVSEWDSDIKKDISFSDKELLILKRCLHEVAQELEEWEFPIRVGITIKEAEENIVFHDSISEA